MRSGSRWLGSALALIFAASCWVSACGGESNDLFNETGGAGSAGAAGSKGGSAGTAGSSLGGSAGSGLGGASQGGSPNQGGSSQGGSPNQGGSAQGGASQGGSGPGGSSQGGSGQGGSGFGGASGNCPFSDSVDHDGDSWSAADGDCNDCDALVNPGAFDGKGPVGIPGIDDDCDGGPDNAITECDTGLVLDDQDPLHAAMALGLCAQTSPAATGKDKRWGVLSARYSKADGTVGMNPLSHGLMPTFGSANAQHGASILVLSSGTARTPTQPGYIAPSDGQMSTQSAAPPGFPKGSTMCPGVVPSNTIFDPAVLEVVVRVPTNAKAFAYQLNLYTYEYPDYVCSAYNDLFLALVSPPPPGSQNGNVSFDPNGNTLGASCSLLQVCTAQTAGGVSFACPLGLGLLAGTGFEADSTGKAHAASGWLRTVAPITPGSTINLRFAVTDVGDAILSTTVLLDRFEWIPPVAAPSTEPVANPL